MRLRSFRRLFAHALAALALCAAAAGQASAAPEEPPAAAATLRAAHLEATPQGARLVLTLDAAPKVQDFALPAPQARLVLDLAPVRVALGPEAATSGALGGAGPVARLRFAQRAPGEGRIVLDLEAPARLGPMRVEAAADGGVRLLAEVVSDPAASSPATPSPATPEPGPVAAAPAGPAPAVPGRRIVIDPGHGGHDPGAIGPAGTREKDVTLAAAKALRAELERRGFAVTLTRGEDAFLPLFERVARARAARAELFISLHADASHNPATKGASVYTLSERGERRALAVADAQNWDLELAEPPKSAIVRDILMDLAQRETTNRSAAFAQRLIGRLSDAAPLLTNTHRNAGFAVLLAPDVPAILLEMGFITNADDERRLTDPKRQADAMAAVAAAVEEFFAAEPRVMAGAGG